MDGKALTGAFTGKHKGVFIAGALGVAALAFFMKKGSNPAPVTAATYPTMDTGSVGSGSSTSGGGITSDQLVTALDANSKTFGAQLEEERAARLAYQNGTLQALNTLSSSFTANYAAVSASLHDMESHVTDPVYTTLAAASGFNEPASAGSAGSVSQHYNSPDNNPVQSFIPVYASYGGVDYNTTSTAGKKAIEQNEARIKTDSSFVDAELARTAAVIKDKQDKHEDTKAQTDYQAKLKKQKAG